MKTFKTFLKESDYSNEHEEKFHKNLHSMHEIDVFHESPGHVKASIEKHGLKGDYGMFGTIGEPSGFVSSAKKTIVHMKVPSNVHHMFRPDMRYDQSAPHKDFLEQHPNMHGGDVNIEINKVPKQWIHKIEEK